MLGPLRCHVSVVLVDVGRFVATLFLCMAVLRHHSSPHTLELTSHAWPGKQSRPNSKSGTALRRDVDQAAGRSRFKFSVILRVAVSAIRADISAVRRALCRN